MNEYYDEDEEFEDDYYDDEDEEYYDEYDDDDEDDEDYEEDDSYQSYSQPTVKDNPVPTTNKTMANQINALTDKFPPHIMSKQNVTIMMEGQHHIFSSTHLLFNDVCNAIKKRDLKKLKSLLVKKAEAIQRGLEIKGDVVSFNGQPLHTRAVQLLLERKRDGGNVSDITAFLENCYKNPYPQVVEKLYEFLESRCMPITEDGCFIGYKYCNKDYYDSYTGKTYQFLPGTVVKAPREDYCDLSGAECSEKGIHVGNYEYSGNMGSNPNYNVVFVKVNPKDVLSVPVGSGAQKIRVWELEVLHDTNGEKHSAPVVDAKGRKLQNFHRGQNLIVDYLDKRNKLHTYSGTVKNVGNEYIELDAGWKETTGGHRGKPGAEKLRLKISKIKSYI